MKLIGNIIWIVFGGLLWAVVLFVGALFFSITIIGIPLGLQLFKLGRFVLWPFGKKIKQVNINLLKRVLNIIWALFFGWEIALGFLFTGVLFCITIIGIPFGRQYFKMTIFTLMPLGRNFVK